MQKTVHEGGRRNGKTEETKQDEENDTKEEEKTWKDRFRKSPCEIFAETINGTAVRENTLFTGFVEKVEDKKNGNGIGPKKINNRDGVSSKDKVNGVTFSNNELEHEDDDGEEKKDWNAIYDAALLLKEVKDIRDELNMIKMVLTQQKLVWEELLGQGGQMSQAMKNSLGTERNLADILKEVVEMDSIAETIQTSVRTSESTPDINISNLDAGQRNSRS
ncbi:hypothetical protein N7520_007608 [Penicillium odoratum]|uniref:uncharacterized protein n=1 Tax=Penicillium odoratum TaxID=1167516 RepID=UPI002549705C|nr:uncharacterized protein N7520_007608 [Penicillium odoratum]KAJ5760452.1 hypothetical protein N7520_007608 [Penicillium odoratum]